MRAVLGVCAPFGGLSFLKRDYDGQVTFLMLICMQFFADVVNLIRDEFIAGAFQLTYAILQRIAHAFNWLAVRLLAVDF